eukprot:3955474-Amphidinium_carterae.1
MKPITGAKNVPSGGSNRESLGFEGKPFAIVAVNVEGAHVSQHCLWQHQPQHDLPAMLCELLRGFPVNNMKLSVDMMQLNIVTSPMHTHPAGIITMQRLPTKSLHVLFHIWNCSVVFSSLSPGEMMQDRNKSS